MMILDCHCYGVLDGLRGDDFIVILHNVADIAARPTVLCFPEEVGARLPSTSRLKCFNGQPS